MRLWFLVALVGAGGCGDDDRPAPVDATVDALVADASVTTVVSPPAPPELTPCPDGWREEMIDGIAACRPYPEAGALECGDGEAHFPGEPECAPVGRACPTGDFPDDLRIDGSVVFVRAGASPGDGTRAMPFGTIAEALAVATDGATVAVGPGTYAERVDVPRPLTLRGACAALTVVEAPASDEENPTILAAVDATIEDLTVTGPAIGIGADWPGHVRVEGVVVRDVVSAGISTLEGDLVARGVVVLDVAVDTTGDFGVGIEALAATVDAERVVIDRYGSVGLSLVQSTGRIARASVRDATGGASGAAVESLDAELVAEQVHVAAARESGIAFVRGSGDATEVLVEDVSDPVIGYGVGLDVSNGTVVDARRLNVVRASTFALLSLAGSTVTVEDVLVRDTQVSATDGRFGEAAGAGQGGRLTLTRAHLRDSHNAAIAMNGLDTVIEATDLAVVGVTPDDVEMGRARGGEMWHGTFRATRALFANATDIGLAGYFGATLELVDVMVRDVRPPGADPDVFGVGIGVYDATATVDRFEIRRAHTCGVHLAEGDAAMDLSHGIVADNVIGACVQVVDFDVSRLADDVLYVGNEVNLDSTSLPVPAPIASF